MSHHTASLLSSFFVAYLALAFASELACSRDAAPDVAPAPGHVSPQPSRAPRPWPPVFTPDFDASPNQLVA